MPKETQQTISEWAETTFGPVSDPKVLVERAAIELEELQQAITQNDVKEAGKETADVVILLYRLMTELGRELDVEVSSKMTENRSRRWQPIGDGTGSHIK